MSTSKPTTLEGYYSNSAEMMSSIHARSVPAFHTPFITTTMLPDLNNATKTRATRLIKCANYYEGIFESEVMALSYEWSSTSSCHGKGETIIYIPIDVLLDVCGVNSTSPPPSTYTSGPTPFFYQAIEFLRVFIP